MAQTDTVKLSEPATVGEIQVALATVFALPYIAALLVSTILVFALPDGVAVFATLLGVIVVSTVLTMLLGPFVDVAEDWPATAGILGLAGMLAVWLGRGIYVLSQVPTSQDPMAMHNFGTVWALASAVSFVAPVAIVHARALRRAGR